MSSPQVIRTAHAGFNNSPIIRLFGQWNNGFVITSHESVIFEMDTNGSNSIPVDFTKMSELKDAVVKTVTGADIGTVSEFDNPLFSPLVTPLVRLKPRANVKYPQLKSSQAINILDLTKNMGVRLDNGTLGTLIDPEDGLPLIGARDYLGNIAPTTVRVAVLSFDVNMSGNEGMPVFINGGLHDGKLLGMLFNLQSGGGDTLAYCSPAALFK